MGNILSVPNDHVMTPSHIPVEILAEILFLVRDPMSLMAVCQLWRSIVLGFQKFWNDAVVSCRRDLVHLPITLERGGAHPLALKLQLISPTPPCEWGHCSHCYGRCLREARCFHIFTPTEIDILVAIIRPHFHRIWSLHLDYQPGLPNFAEKEWAMRLLSKFDQGMPALERLTIKSFHAERLPPRFMNNDTPNLVELFLYGQRSWVHPHRPGTHFLQGNFTLQSFTVNTHLMIPYSDIMSVIQGHSPTLSSLELSLPPPLDSDPFTIPSYTLTMPHLTNISIHGLQFILEPIYTTNLKSITASITLDDNGPFSARSILIKNYMKGLPRLFKFLIHYRHHIRYLDMNIGHYSINGHSYMSQLILPAFHFRALTVLVLCTNIPSATVLHQIHVPSLQHFDFTVMKPEGVSFALLLPFLKHCQLHLRSLRINSERSAPYSMDFEDTSVPLLSSLTTLFVRAPNATLFAQCIQQCANGLTNGNIIAHDVNVPLPHVPQWFLFRSTASPSSSA